MMQDPQLRITRFIVLGHPAAQAFPYKEGHVDLHESMVSRESLHCNVSDILLDCIKPVIRLSYRYQCIPAVSVKPSPPIEYHFLELNYSFYQNHKMKTSLPIAFALFGAALAAPVQPQGDIKRSEAESPDILYNNQAGWGKRSEAESPDILYNNQAGWGKKRSEAESPDILYNNAAGWGKKRSEAESPDILYNNAAGWGKKRSEAESPDILYNNQAGWGKKRSEAESPDILYNNQAGWGKKRSEAESPDILYNNQAGWGKRSAA